MTTQEMIRKHLLDHGHAGLCNPGAECGCTLEDFMPCGGDFVMKCLAARVEHTEEGGIMVPADDAGDEVGDWKRMKEQVR